MICESARNQRDQRTVSMWREYRARPYFTEEQLFLCTTLHFIGITQRIEYETCIEAYLWPYFSAFNTVRANNMVHLHTSHILHSCWSWFHIKLHGFYLIIHGLMLWSESDTHTSEPNSWSWCRRTVMTVDGGDLMVAIPTDLSHVTLTIYENRLIAMLIYLQQIFI